jgi:glycerate-2-kinase
VIQSGHPVAAPCAIIGGGETTVMTNGVHGQGGPNQEFAVAAALEVAGLDNIVALGLDTDGTDGPTRYAGALVDGSTQQMAREAGIDLYSCLSRHDVTPALERIRLNILTGNTGTNVNDLKLVLVAP